MAVPLSLFGALVFLNIGVATLNIYTEVGLITLVGLITKHGILMVEFANDQQVRHGRTRREAIELAAKVRLRPILMTTAAMVLGVIPLVTASGAGAAARFSMGLVIAAGMSIGTIGVGAEAATTTNVGKDIIAYSTSAGLFAGGAFEGAAIKPRKDWNAAVYGVGNDNPSAIVQRDKLRVATNLKDALNKDSSPAAGASSSTEEAPAAADTSASQPVPQGTPAPSNRSKVDVVPLN